MNLYKILEDKLEKVAESVGYEGEPKVSEKYRILEQAWHKYVEDLGIQVAVVSDTFPKDDMIGLQDPLYTSGMTLAVPKETAERILVLGLP